jgi:hypothetical protein
MVPRDAASKDKYMVRKKGMKTANSINTQVSLVVLH